MNKNYRFETNQLHAGQTVDPATKSRAVPIYQTTSFTFDNAEQAENMCALKESGNLYSRFTNPTVAVFEERIAVLEGGVAALATSSGSSAILYSILNIAIAGDHIIASSTLYGGTYNLFSKTLPKFGIEVSFVNPEELSNFENAIKENTKAIFIESLGNPRINIIDIEKVAEIAHLNGIPIIIDNTFASPYLLRPIEYGADIVVHSATKFIGGHGTTLGGVIVDSGKFDWAKSGKFPEFTTPDESYHGIRYAQDIGAAAYVVKARIQLLRDTGACLSPFNAFLLIQGLETLSLRVERHVQNAIKVAEFLKNHEKVSWVAFPSLEGDKYNALAKIYFPKGAGSIFAFGVKGGESSAKAFINELDLFSQLLNVADAKSLVIHPSSTTHSQLSDEQQISAGVTKDMIRISIGIENVDDLIEDIQQALEKIC